MKIQVNNEKHYAFNNYLTIDRWNSYYYQIKYSLNDEFKNIILFGKGDGLVPLYLKHLNKNIVTFDYDKSLNPNIIGDIRNIKKYINEKYDCVLCCSILEHLPFDYFEKILKDIKDITNKRLILCLPYNGSYIANKTIFSIRKHKKIFKWCIHFKRILKKDYDIDKDGFHEHYWEVNVSKYSNKIIDNIIKKNYCIEEKFIPNENPYHLFYILKPKQ